LLRWPLLPITLIGIANVEAWYAYSFWGLNWRWSLFLLVGLAFIAGWYTREKLWGTVLVMLVPTMFVGGDYHGHPWQWLVFSFVNPLILGYFLQNMTPIVVGYWVLVSVGVFTRAKLARHRRSE